MTKLYKLTEQYNTISNMLDSDNYEYITKESIHASLADIKDQITDKIDSIAKLVLSLKTDVTGIESEIVRLQRRKESINNTIEWLKGYLLTEMVFAKLNKVKKDVVTISIADNPPSVESVDEELLPVEYRKIIPETWHIDKIAIISHFKETGEIVPGVVLAVNRKHVNIR